MAICSSILAWRISWTEEPGRLQTVESQESDMTEQLTHTHRIMEADKPQDLQSELSVNWNPGEPIV